ncbi:MAG: hypothetical protein ACMG6E_04295 [Candidatus Roizmanbacteria bacterium]
MRVHRFKPKFNEEENKHLDMQIDQLLTELTMVSPHHKIIFDLIFLIDNKEM